MFPFPLLAPLVFIAAATQFSVAFDTLELKLITALLPAQITMDCGLTVKVGVGLTVTEKETFDPTQPFKVAFTEMFPTKDPPLEFTGATQPGIAPFPDALSPMDGFELTQLKVAPAGVDAKV